MSFPKLAEYYTVDQQQMIEVDRLMIEELGINLFQMMENAGSTVARIIRAKYLAGNSNGTVNVVAGPGGNGGGALVAGRRLAAIGMSVNVCLSRPESELSPVALHQLNALRSSGTVVVSDDVDAEALVSVDGIIGYSLVGEPRGRSAALIDQLNGLDAPVVSVDVPSGFSVAEQGLMSHHVIADATATLAANKVGLDTTEVSAAVGELYLCDIAVPSALLDRVTGQKLALKQFGDGDIVRIS